MHFEGRTDTDVSYPVEELPFKLPRMADVTCCGCPAASLEPLGDYHVRLFPRLTITILTSIQGGRCTTRTTVLLEPATDAEGYNINPEVFI